MPLYRYTAKNMDSGVIKGDMEAAGREELAALLRSKGQYLVRAVKLSEKDSAGYKPKLKELADFCAELGTMLSSGITLVHAMGIIIKNNETPKMTPLYQKLYVALQQGKTFSEALAEQERAFPVLMVNIFRSGEAGGTMDKAAGKAADLFTKEHRIRSKIKSAMMYPIILSVVAVIALIVIFTFVLPSFFSTFEKMKMELPAITQAMKAFSNLLVNQWAWCLLVVVAVVFAVSMIFQLPKVKLWKDKTKLRLPKIGKLMRTIYTARFARTLSSLYSSGLTMIQSLSVAAETVGNQYIANQFDSVLAKVRSGSSLSAALAEVDGFAPKLVAIISIGEESGRLDEMLMKMADAFDFDSEKAIDRMIALIEPVMIVILAVGVLVLMLSVLLPLYTMYDNLRMM